jgi:hypothetical protein
VGPNDAGIQTFVGKAPAHLFSGQFLLAQASAGRGVTNITAHDFNFIRTVICIQNIENTHVFAPFEQAGCQQLSEVSRAPGYDI